MAGIKLDAGALPRRHAGAERRAGRPHHADLGQPQRLGAALSRRQGQDAGGRQPEAAAARSPKCRPPPRRVPGYEAVTWFGLFTTAGTPREVIGKINAEVRALFAEPAFRDRAIMPNMFESMVSSPEQFADFIKRDSAKWAQGAARRQYQGRLAGRPMIRDEPFACRSLTRLMRGARWKHNGPGRSPRGGIRAPARSGRHRGRVELVSIRPGTPPRRRVEAVRPVVPRANERRAG